MNRKWIFSLFLCFCMFMFTGCVKTKDLTEEQQNLIAEYSAGALLRHEDTYARKLVYPEEAPVPEVTPVPVEATEPPKEQQDTPDAGEPGEEKPAFAQVSLDEIYQVPGLSVTYSSYVICKEYPKGNSVYQMTAAKGEKYLIARFKVKNKKSGKLKVNLQKRDIEYPMTMDGKEYQPTIAMQKNGGLNYLKTSLKAGESQEAVVVYCIPADQKKPDSVKIKVRDSKKEKESAVTCKKGKDE